MAETAEIKFKLDDRELSVPPGTLVIEAARQQGIEVPSFCYYGGLALQAACRMCLVEVEKAPKLQTACTLVAVNGMVVRTNTPQVHEARKSMLEFLLANHPLDCPVCDKGGECELQDMVFRYGADRTVSDSVCTTMPSATGSVQPTCSFGVFSTSTRHMRHAACSVSPW